MECTANRGDRYRNPDLRPLSFDPMCLILFAYRAHPEYRLVLAANRDEFHDRPSAPAGFWSDAPNVLAGRDLRSGGSWLGITRTGRFAAVTNYRDPRELLAPRSDAPSRGELVSSFLRGSDSPVAYLAALAGRAGAYHGFNLLVGDRESLYWFSNRAGAAPRRLQPGIYGLSNHLLDTPWPKVVRGREALRDALAAAAPLDEEPLFRLLADRAAAADQELPDTGVGIERERLLSAPFIASAEYGTRASTVLLVRSDGGAHLVERTFTPGSARWSEVRHALPPPVEAA